MRKRFFTILVLLAVLTPAASYGAADEETFNRIFVMKMAELTEATFDLLDEKYPDEDWDAYDFPKYVYTSDSVEAGYRVAVKAPDLLRQVPCYCFCDAMGHSSLLDCFVKRGDEQGFDEHAVGCNICYGQAMMAFLWHEEGFGMERILAAFEKRFEPLVEKHGKAPEGGR